MSKLHPRRCDFCGKKLPKKPKNHLYLCRTCWGWFSMMIISNYYKMSREVNANEG